MEARSSLEGVPDGRTPTLEAPARYSQRASTRLTLPPPIEESVQLQEDELARLRRSWRPTLHEELRTSTQEARLSTRSSEGGRRTTRFYQPPTFHMSILSESDLSNLSGIADRDDRGATFTELFFDLVYVVPLTKLTEMHLDTGNYAVFVLYYIALANTWMGEAFFNTRFDTDDAIVRMLTVVRVVSLVVMAYGINKQSPNTFGVAYLVLRGILIVQYFRAWYNTDSHHLRRLCMGYMLLFSFSWLCWVAGLPCAYDLKFTLFALGTCVDLATPFVLLYVMVPVHQRHMPDRLASFTIVVISVMLTQVIDYTLAHQDDQIFLLCLLCAVLIPYCLMTLYTNVCGVPIGIEEFSSSLWHRFLTYMHFYLHIPFTGSIVYTTKALQSISCGGPANLTAAHSIVGTSLTLVLLGCHHFFVQGNTYDRTLTRIVRRLGR